MGASALAVVRRHDVTEPQMLQNALTFPQVGILRYSNSTGDTRTANLVGDKFIVTAGHNLPGSGVTATVEFGGQTYTTSVWQRHPNYNGSNLALGYDICVARLDRRVLNVAPLGIYPAFADENGQAAWVVGWGRSGTGLTGIQSGTVGFRAGQNRVDYDSTTPNILLADFDSPDNPAENSLASLGSTPEPMPFESCIASGDSGGALLLLNAGKWEVAGIHSAVGATDSTFNSDYGDFSVFTRIQPARQWIVDRLWENGRVAGHIQLDDYVASPQGVPLTIEIREVGTTNVVETRGVPLAIDGGFSFSTTLRGRYDIAVKGSKWLRHVWSDLNITNNTPGGLTATLAGGDVDGDNEIGPGDFALLAGAFLSVNGDPNWSDQADLDGDGEVGPGDFAILSANFLQTGAP